MIAKIGKLSREKKTRLVNNMYRMLPYYVKNVVH